MNLMSAHVLVWLGIVLAGLQSRATLGPQRPRASASPETALVPTVAELRSALSSALSNYDDSAASEVLAKLARMGSDAGDAVPEIFDAFHHPVGHHPGTTSACYPLRLDAAMALRAVGADRILNHPAADRWLGMEDWPQHSITLELELKYAQMLQSPHTELASFAARMLSTAGSDRLEIIGEWLKSNDPALQERGARVAASLGPPSIRWLIELNSILVSGPEHARQWAAIALGNLLPASGNQMINCLASRASQQTRREIFLAFESSLGSPLYSRLDARLSLGCGGSPASAYAPSQSELALLDLLASNVGQEGLRIGLQDKSTEIQELALLAVSKLPRIDEPMLDELLALRSSPDLAVRELAAKCATKFLPEPWPLVSGLVGMPASNPPDATVLIATVSAEAEQMSSARPWNLERGSMGFVLPSSSAQSEFHLVCKLLRRYGPDLLAAADKGNSEARQLLVLFNDKLSDFGISWVAAASETSVTDSEARVQLLDDGQAIAPIIVAGWLWGAWHPRGGCDEVVWQQLGWPLSSMGDCSLPALIVGLEHPRLGVLAGEYLTKNVQRCSDRSAPSAYNSLLWAWRKPIGHVGLGSSVEWEDMYSAQYTVKDPFDGHSRPLTYVEYACKVAGSEIIPILVRGLSDPCAIVRERCCFGLGVAGQWSAETHRLVRIHMGDDEPRVRRAASYAIALHSVADQATLTECRVIWVKYSN